MATIQSPDPDPGADEPPDAPPPMPDEDGPHDVPDATVIEKTLPSRPVHGDDTPTG
ncbi:MULTISPECIES: hypothetical protein [Ramlibacter]|uniref:Uncharacterized protein n=1 Tax=Ramlibacter pinisoli TaxID=2682844 RepID=A0A6N8IYL9_9BURK|nr:MULTISPECIES: hypothetical protein [Ramlibacter]MBA2961112.1 hypothetical protein [Ramlibacter sp. CGMCC 1.13660]MVQ31056.1 hypothetical protein [Ramlibacter pinisoli]